MIKQHFLVSLKRTPERTWSWVGAQSVHGFPFDKTTLFEAIDFRDFPTNGDLYRFLVNSGIDFAKQGVEKEPFASEPLRSPSLAVFASKWCVFKIIAEKPDGWYGVWSDDAILTVPYQTFRGAVESVDGFEVLVPFVPAHKNCPEIWLNKEFVNGRTDLYKGFIGYGESVFILKPSGAQQLLDVQDRNFNTWLDTLGSEHNDQFQNVATFAYPYIKEHSNISGMRSTSAREFEDGIHHVPIFKETVDATNL